MDLSENVQVRKMNSPVIRNLAKIKNSVGSEMTGELLPFKPVMKRLLAKKGYDTRFMSFTDMIPLYYNEYVSNKNNVKNYFQPINCFEFAENPVFKFSSSDNLNGDIFTHENRAYFNKVASVTDAIVNDFRVSKIKYKQFYNPHSNNFDTALSNEDIIKGKAVVKVENNLRSKIDGNRPVTIKQMLIVGAIFLLLIYMSK